MQTEFTSLIPVAVTELQLDFFALLFPEDKAVNALVVTAPASKAYPLVLDFAQVIGLRKKEYFSWAKTVTAIDQAKPKGYSLIGELVSEGLAPRDPGVYVAKDRGNYAGTRPDYHVIVVSTHDAKVVHVLKDGERDWAVRLWEPLKAALNGTTQHNITK